MYTRNFNPLFSSGGGVMRKMRNETFNILTQLKYHVQ